MPKIAVNMSPDIDSSALMDMFRKKFPQYEISRPAMIGVDFALTKSAWTAVAVRLIRNSKGAFISLNAFIPSMAARFFLGGLLAYLILMCTSWPKMVKEVREYVETAQEFKLG